MDEVGHIGFDVYFSKLPDPRISRKKLYPLIEILFVVLCGSNGIACKDTFARVFAVLDPEAFKSCFVSWVKSLQSALQDVIAIDGKTLCNSADLQNNRPAIHMVSAFATGARLVLAQQKVVDMTLLFILKQGLA